MLDRRPFIKYTSMGASLMAAPVSLLADAMAGKALPRRSIPGTGDSLPVIGLGISNAFRQGDLPGSTALIRLFHEHGGAYIDCSGDSRFVVASVADSLGIGRDLFLGAYFSGDDLRADRNPQPRACTG